MDEPNELDLDELGVALIVQSVVDAGTYQLPASGRAEGMAFFLTGEFDRWADALQISPGTRERISALARLRNKSARQRQFG